MADTFLQIWPLILLGDLARYVIGAGVVFLAVSVWWGRALAARRIQIRRPMPADVKREITHSLLTVVIFSLVGYGVLLGIRAGVLRVYGAISDYGWIWWVLSIGVLIGAHDTYFYWTHRLLHHPRVFRWAHRTHHLSHTPTPWAAYAFAPAEAVIQAAYLPLILLVVPTHGSVIFVFVTHMILRNAIGHCGVELMPRGVLRWLRWQPITAVTHHDLHHSTVRWNFGLYFTWWDRLMGTEHPDYPERLATVLSPERPPESDRPDCRARVSRERESSNPCRAAPARRSL